MTGIGLGPSGELLAVQELDLARFGNRAYFRVVEGVPPDPDLPE